MKHQDKNLRAEERNDACLYVCIHEQDKEIKLGILADLSEKGFKLSSETPVKIYQEYTLQIKNPYIAKGDSFGEFTAKAVWSLQPRENVYYTGFAFTARSEEADQLFPKLQEAFKKASQAVKQIAC